MGIGVYSPNENSIVHKTSADFGERKVGQFVNILQYDKNFPIIEVSLYLNGYIYEIPSDIMSSGNMRIRFGKKDGTYVIKNILGANSSEHPNKVYFDVDDQMSYDYGKFYPILEIIFNGETAGSSYIPFNIERNPVQNGDIESHSVYPEIEELVEMAHTHDNKAILDTFLDDNYVHTDNNFTNDYKNKVDESYQKAHEHSNKTILDNFNDANYVHTDNNFTNSYKTKIEENETGLSNEITNRQSDTSDLNNKINKSLLDGVGFTPGATGVVLNKSFKNIKTGAETSSTESMPLASDSQAGIMSKEDYSKIRENTSRIAALEGQTVRLLYQGTSNPTAAQISAFVISQGYSETSGIAVVIASTYHIWHYYENENPKWKDDGVDTVTEWTNSSPGIVKGSTDVGKIHAETDGTGSVNGWDALVSNVNSKQDAIGDLSTIRSGAALGATAVQPSALNSYLPLSAGSGKPLTGPLYITSKCEIAYSSSDDCLNIIFH